jgi:hypothetical protein
VRGGDGKPIIEGAKDLADKGAKTVETGVEKAGGFIDNLFNKKK